jgi:aminoglycoside phosphotransferase (APT) family kinase protein
MRAVSEARMHEDEVETDRSLVRRLLVSQYPQWADLPIERVQSAGTDNAMYRLGDDMAVRLPRIHWAIDAVAKEAQWLPVLAPHLPLSIPVPIATGAPEADFPYPWTVVPWIPGEMATINVLDDPVQAARDLAAFVRALQSIDSHGGPQHRRGRPVRLQDDAVRRGVTRLRGEVDGAALLDAWSRVLDVPDYDGPPMWFHGDLAYLNLIASHGALRGVIDWGTCAVGDPAIDTIVAWGLFPNDARRVYRDALDIDDATWTRGMGWVLTGVGAPVYYRETNPILVADKIKAIEAVLQDPP